MPELGLSPAQLVYGHKLKIVLSTTAALLNANNTKDIRRKLKKKAMQTKTLLQQTFKTNRGVFRSPTWRLINN